MLSRSLGIGSRSRDSAGNNSKPSHSSHNAPPSPEYKEFISDPDDPTRGVWAPPSMMQRNLPGSKGSHFGGPVMSGPPVGAPYPLTAGQNPQVSGVAPCALTLLLDYSMGNFSIPIAFPPASFIYSWLSVTFAAFAVGPVAFTMGSTSGATDIFSNGSFGAANGELDQNITGSLPLWTAVSPAVPFQGWLNVTGNTGGPAGQGLIVLFYVRLPLPWN